MKLFKRIVLWALLLIVAFFAVQTIRHWDTIRRVMLGGYHTHETVPPQLPSDLKHPAVLVFSKTNGFRHEEAIAAAKPMFEAMAKKNGWSVFQTENGAAFSPEILGKFDVVVFSNTSGDVFNEAQREAFKAWVENGGGWVGFHAAGDNSWDGWPWYVDTIIGAHFIGHPLSPQFQKATLHVEDHHHPATQNLGDTWSRIDEWYSFAKSPRKPEVSVLATLDESTYKPVGPMGKNLRMGKDHPAIWTHCQGRGRVLYSIIGHTAESFTEAENVVLLENAIGWAINPKHDRCDSLAVSAPTAKDTK